MLISPQQLVCKGPMPFSLQPLVCKGPLPFSQAQLVCKGPMPVSLQQLGSKGPMLVRVLFSTYELDQLSLSDLQTKVAYELNAVSLH